PAPAGRRRRTARAARSPSCGGCRTSTATRSRRPTAGASPARASSTASGRTATSSPATWSRSARSATGTTSRGATSSAAGTPADSPGGLLLGEVRVLRGAGDAPQLRRLLGAQDLAGVLGVHVDPPHLQELDVGGTAVLAGSLHLRRLSPPGR